MNRTPKQKLVQAAPVNPGRHEAQCSICNHAQRDEIEREFVTWELPKRIGEAYGVSRDAIYRHAHARDLFSKRRLNVRMALERIIENAGQVKANAAAVVSAVATYARINTRGEWVEKRETVDLNALFERMSTPELEQYARNGTLPAWFPVSVDATGTEGQGGPDGQ